VVLAVKTNPIPQTSEELYLDLLKKTLTRAQVAPSGDPMCYMEPVHMTNGRVEDAETMIGTKQLDNIQFCVTDVLRRKVPGDLIEAGVWRGGVTVFMAAILKAYGDKDRCVWAADSFEGLPNPDSQKDSPIFRQGEMAVSLEEVKENFTRYGLLDSRVRFLKGLFCNTLPGARIEKLSVLRADADLYESTRDVLKNLYPKLSVGGYAIFDDYSIHPAVRSAIDEYRRAHNITEKIERIDSQAVYWQKQKSL
jgi:hypothetical protein